MKAYRDDLKIWKKLNNLNMVALIKDKNKVLEEMQSRIQIDPSSQSDKEPIQEIESLKIREELFWRQRAKEHMLKEIETPISFICLQRSRINLTELIE